MEVALWRFGAQRQEKKIEGEPDLRGEPAASGAEKGLNGISSLAVWSVATKKRLRASPTCAASPPHQVLRNVYKDVTLWRFGAQRHKKTIEGEPDLRGEPAASGAEEF